MSRSPVVAALIATAALASACERVVNLTPPFDGPPLLDGAPGSDGAGDDGAPGDGIASDARASDAEPPIDAP